MMKINCKQKGKAGELEFSHLCQSHGFDTRRGQQYCGASGDADVIGLDRIHLEVKRVEKLNIYEAIEQSINDSRSNEIPIVCHRRNRKPWLITMEAEQWFELYQTWLEKHPAIK